MIIYSLISNRGGMLRVAESLAGIYEHLPKDFPLEVFIFSEEPPFAFTSEKFKWFHLENTEEAHIPETMQRLQQEVKAVIADRQVDWIIADFMTLDFFSGIDAKICYDVHFLGRPFFNALSKTKNAQLMDDATSKNFVLSLHVQHFPFVKFEAKHMRKAERFIVNSETSRRDLLTLYSDVATGKGIDYIPVSTALKNFEAKANFKEAGLYFHGRYHPQKGLHFLLQKNWLDLPLTMRGFDPNFLNAENSKHFQSIGITPLPWTSDSALIHQEILDHEIILFPSIYEPWGLSLQEALALGKLCVAHRCDSGHEEQINHGENGFLLDFAAADLKERIKEIVDLPSGEKNKIKQRAKELSHLGHEKRIQALKAFILELKIQ